MLTLDFPATCAFSSTTSSSKASFSFLVQCYSHLLARKCISDSILAISALCICSSPLRFSFALRHPPYLHGNPGQSAGQNDLKVSCAAQHPHQGCFLYAFLLGLFVRLPRPAFLYCERSLRIVLSSFSFGKY